MFFDPHKLKKLKSIELNEFEYFKKVLYISEEKIKIYTQIMYLSLIHSKSHNKNILFIFFSPR